MPATSEPRTKVLPAFPSTGFLWLHVLYFVVFLENPQSPVWPSWPQAPVGTDRHTHGEAGRAAHSSEWQDGRGQLGWGCRK